MDWTIEFSERADKQLRKLDKSITRRIIDELTSIRESGHQRSRGKALTGNLAGLWRYRVGDYRIVCKIRDGHLLILVIDVNHRSKIYR